MKHLKECLQFSKNMVAARKKEIIKPKPEVKEQQDLLAETEILICGLQLTVNEKIKNSEK